MQLIFFLNLFTRAFKSFYLSKLSDLNTDQKKGKKYLIVLYSTKNISQKKIESIAISKTLKLIKTPIATKNKWLYPEDNFGKMEKGVVKD